jgi:hypothetical protein
MLPRVQKRWTLTLPSELPFWELESQWTPKFSEGECRGHNPLNWNVFYIIGKLLKRRYLKWACMTHLDIRNTSYGQKKGRESNWQFDSRPLKVENWHDFLTWKWHVIYRWKAFNKSYSFALNIISIGGLHTKLWGPKVPRVPTLGISRFPFGSPRTKCHLDVGLMERHRVYYKEECGDFLQVRVAVSLVNLSLLVARPSTKSAPAMH